MTYNFNSWHHGLSNLWLQAIPVALHALDDEESISTLELYTPTMAQDTIINVSVQMTTM